MKRFFAAAAVFSMLIALTPASPVMAQSTSGDTMSGDSGSATGQSDQNIKHEKLTEEKLQAFVNAAIEILKLRQEWQPKIQNAGDAAEQQDMVKAAQEAMAKAVDDTPGITQAEYVGIAQAAQKNQKLAQLIKNRVTAAAKKENLVQ